METIVYAGRCLDRNILENSSSGGAFTALSQSFLQDGNGVLCSFYNYENNCVDMHLVLNIEERDRARGSMYIQSYPGDSWKAACSWLTENPDKKIMFFGLGCQAAAFISFCKLKGIRNRIIVIDIICHGSPSPLIWKDYIRSLVGNGELSDVNFRNKRTGWSKSIGTAKIDGNEVSLSLYRKVYSGRYTLRDCCSSCPYTQVRRETDITIGDFWNLDKCMPDFYDEIGTSVFLVHTVLGRSVLEIASTLLDLRESNPSDCWQPNLEAPTKHSDTRFYFWRDYRKKGITYTMRKYGSNNLKYRIIRKITRIFVRSGGGNF